ncbi:hypothetical protein SADUNF_Sadunf02G0053300 [Salix dunnii]|uniref:Uncharacterized protein n=1 Tax=Salix dunnii TaxID=1413687 RepID=A0A835N6E4_9ROSI|nr:hypothetical protein SADUNF_Sadunf02G0053300 [Salix dunnii]
MEKASQVKWSSESLMYHVDNMITPRKLIKAARKWQKLPAIRRKRKSFPRNFGYGDAVACSGQPSMVEKGHFVVYSAGGKRKILDQPFRLAEEELGLQSNEWPSEIAMQCKLNGARALLSPKPCIQRRGKSFSPDTIELPLVAHHPRICFQNIPSGSL